MSRVYHFLSTLVEEYGGRVRNPRTSWEGLERAAHTKKEGRSSPYKGVAEAEDHSQVGEREKGQVFGQARKGWEVSMAPREGLEDTGKPGDRACGPCRGEGRFLSLWQVKGAKGGGCRFDSMNKELCVTACW